MNDNGANDAPKFDPFQTPHPEMPAPTTQRILILTTLAMLAFAANSLLCRLALKFTPIDAATFTAIRLLSASMVLMMLVSWRGGAVAPIGAAQHANLPPPASWRSEGNWPSAAALFVYAAGFSLAYLELTAATGALLLFGSVQVSMIGYGIFKGERLSPVQMLGFLMALAGLVLMLLPGLAAPPLKNAALMVLAGVAWGMYSIRGRGTQHPIAATTGNFVRTLPFTLVLSAVWLSQFSFSMAGAAYALASGALASGLGYVIWYQVLPALKATQAAAVQLSVPVIAALGGVLFIGEALSLTLVAASVAVLAGIGLVIWDRGRS